jgi:hypothetical protein
MTHCCPQCQSSWRFPSELTLEDWRELCELKEDLLGLPALLKLEARTDIEPASAKSVGLHLAILGIECHQCHEEVAPVGMVICPNCSALNYAYVR